MLQMDFGANYIIIYKCYNLIDSILKISGFFKPDIEFYGGNYVKWYQGLFCDVDYVTIILNKSFLSHNLVI